MSARPVPSSLTSRRVVVTGGAGFLGRAVVAALEHRGVERIDVPRRADYDLTTAEGAERMYRDMEPDVVLHLAAEVGGIGANQANPGRYFFANMAMALHLVEAGRKAGIRKFVQVGTVCSYPRDTKVPFRESDLWDGYPESTNAPYGVAKKAAMVMLEAYRAQYGLASACPIPVNLYGPHDNFDPATSHVIPALIRRCIEARERGQPDIVCWGTGSASREFLFVDDAAEGIVRCAESIEEPVPINLGTGSEVAIRDLVVRIAALCRYEGEIVWDASRPDGQPRRCLDTSRAEQLLGWRAQVDLEDGLARTVSWYEARRSAGDG
jgi:GDP-L-fucose synthase